MKVKEDIPKPEFALRGGLGGMLPLLPCDALPPPCCWEDDDEDEGETGGWPRADGPLWKGSDPPAEEEEEVVEVVKVAEACGAA